MKRNVVFIVFLASIVSVSGCLGSFTGIQAQFGILGPKYTATEKLSVSASSVLDPVESGRTTNVIFDIKNTGNTTIRDVKAEITDTCLFDASEKSKEVGELDPGEFVTWEVDMEAQDVQMGKNCKIRYRVSYLSNATARYDVAAMSEDEYLRLKKRGNLQERLPELRYSKTDTPVDIQVSLDRDQPLVSGDEFYMNLKLVNQGEGNVEDQKLRGGTLNLGYPNFLQLEGCQGEATGTPGQAQAPETVEIESYVGEGKRIIGTGERAYWFCAGKKYGLHLKNIDSVVEDNELVRKAWIEEVSDEKNPITEGETFSVGNLDLEVLNVREDSMKVEGTFGGDCQKERGRVFRKVGGSKKFCAERSFGTTLEDIGVNGQKIKTSHDGSDDFLKEGEWKALDYGGRTVEIRPSFISHPDASSPAALLQARVPGENLEEKLRVSGEGTTETLDPGDTATADCYGSGYDVTLQEIVSMDSVNLRTDALKEDENIFMSEGESRELYGGDVTATLEKVSLPEGETGSARMRLECKDLSGQPELRLERGEGGSWTSQKTFTLTLDEIKENSVVVSEGGVSEDVDKGGTKEFGDLKVTLNSIVQDRPYVYVDASADDYDITGECKDTSKKTSVPGGAGGQVFFKEKTFYQRETPPVTCKFTASKVDIIEEGSFDVGVTYKYILNKQLPVKVIPS